MDNSNKEIAKRINYELKNRDWSQTDLLREIIKFKFPNISKAELYAEVKAKKGNFSTALKRNSDRSISKEDLYIISKVFGVPLEYIWFGDEKKSGFIPKGARYAAYQDSESEYRSYIASLEYEDRIQYGDEFGFSLFDYFGQFDSINGYKFFLDNYGLHFDYAGHGELSYINGEKYPQLCSPSDRDNLLSNHLINTLVEHDEIKMFKAIYFDNCSLDRFDPGAWYRNKNYFRDDFLNVLLKNEQFLDLALKTKVVDMNSLDEHYEKGTKRTFVEPMFYEALSFAIEHEEEYEYQLEKMLSAAVEYNKTQFEAIKEYLKNNKEHEFGDASIDRYSPRFLRSSRNELMGNIIRLNKTSSNDTVNKLIKEVEQYAFNMTHIINEQEKNNEEIKISTPDNPLFSELHENAIAQRADFIPTIVREDKGFTYFQYYESNVINPNNIEQLKVVIDVLNKSQALVKLNNGQSLVHGNMEGRVLMSMDGKTVGLAGWQKCHRGNKYEDRAELLSNVDIYYFDEKYLVGYKELFEVLSQDFNKEEQLTLLDKAIDLLNSKRKKLLKDDRESMTRAIRLKERCSKLEFFKEVYLNK